MKNFFVTIALAGLILAGCATNETEGYDIPNPNVINFSSSTSRAVIADLSTLTDDPGGFRVYGATADATGAWYTNVDGENNYRYDSNWGWAGDNAEWPTVDASYPMNFYAMYPADAPTTVTAATVLSRDVKIAATATAQRDLLAAYAKADSKPASGQLSLTFKHILSKVNFGVIAGHDKTPEIQAIAVRNVHSENTYNYITQAWGEATTTISSGYDYFRNAAAPFTVTGADASEESAEPLFTGNHTGHLMLMPQSADTGAPAAWDLTPEALATNAYIEVIYRITEGSDDYIGYTAGADYLTDYPAFVNGSVTWGTWTRLGTGGGTEYNGALYIKVGFPVTVNWTPGKGYTYNICLGTADSINGHYTDTTYYDKDGNDTGIPVIGPDGEQVEPGDPVTSGIINFLIDVTNWDNSPTATPLQ